jgi:hypothetical protein
MRATELIEEFNRVMRLTQRAWEYQGVLFGDDEAKPDQFERLDAQRAEADRAAAEFCRLLSDNESS